MRSIKLFSLLVLVGLVCIEARVVKCQKKARQVCRKRTNVCSPVAIIELPVCKLPPLNIGPCSCQNIYIDDAANCACNCKYENFMPRCAQLQSPNTIANFDALTMPGINLPGLFDLVIDAPCSNQGLPFVTELPGPCQASISYQIIETPCCRTLQAPIVEYLSPIDIPNSFLPQAYFIETPNYQPKVIQLPGCTAPKVECQNGYCMQCRCQDVVRPPCGCPDIIRPPCNCPNIVKPVSACDNAINSICGLPCGTDFNCGCVKYNTQLPGSATPCACQLPAVDLPVYRYGCPSLSPPDSCGKYLRQVTLQPPFL